jgi:ribose 5-phosphate isomerase
MVAGDRGEGVGNLDPFHVVVVGVGTGAVLHHGLTACGRLEADGEDEDVLRIAASQMARRLLSACVRPA